MNENLSVFNLSDPQLYQGLANRTAEKQRPGPLELTLFFKVP